MKSFFLIFPLLFLSFFGFAQEKNGTLKYSLHCYPVIEMVVFPGCESIDSKNIKEMQECFQEKLQELLSQNLEDF